LTRYNTDERLTRVTPEFCQRTIRDVEKLQKEFRRTLGTTFAFLGDELYIRAGAEIPSRRHYGSYPQIEDGVGMVRSFLNAFEKVLSEPPAVAGGLRKASAKNVRTHAVAVAPAMSGSHVQPPATAGGSDLKGTILTGEMFAPILTEQIERYNNLRKSRLTVMAVPNAYFGGDVSVAGLLTGQDLVAMKDKIVGEFVIIPRVTIKSDEPMFLDGMTYDRLKAQFDVPVYDLDTDGLIDFLK
jgi:NifB/MoaA-like Fe-S oxidoreductase